MALIKVLIDTGSGGYSELDGLQSIKEELPKLINYLQAINSGAKSAKVEIDVNGVKKTSSITISASGQQEDETFTICGEVFTLKNNLGGAGATGFLVLKSDVPATMAANIKAGIDLNKNTALGLAGVVGDVTVASNVVTIQAAEGGRVGNAIVVSEAMTQATAASGATGVDGSSYTLANK
jgi:hypothetical protein